MLTIKSEKNLSDWRGSMTFLNGFLSTRPSQEIQNQPYEVIKGAMCPEVPFVEIDKTKGTYFVPCILKDAPLVGSTLVGAQKSGKPVVGKMRSKAHATEADMIVIDIDGLEQDVIQTAVDKMTDDDITFMIFSSFSHGNPNKPDVRARMVILVDKSLGIDDYSKAWHGIDQHYFGGQVAKKDSSSSRMYQQQGVWMTHPDWQDQAFKDEHNGGIASADFLIELGANVQETPAESTKIVEETPAASTQPIDAKSQDYPPSDANQVADRCQQIGAFRDQKGAGQSEPLWNDCLGVVGHCENGQEFAQAWSSGHPGYRPEATEKKLAHRLHYGPTTCEQFKKTNPEGCQGCQQTCKSPITLGWSEQTVTPQPTPVAKEVVPWPHDVELTGMLAEIKSIVKRHIVLDDDQAIAVTLWIAMTWLVAATGILPLLLINAPEKGCGKTQLLDLIGRLVCNAFTAVNVTAPVLFRMIDLHQPTLMLDEVDTFLKDKSSDICGIINAGHSRSSAFVYRLVGDAYEPKAFSVYCPKAMAGITLEKHLADSTMSRGIVINMKRKLPGERVERMRNADKSAFERLQSQLAKFGTDYQEHIAQARPDLPDQLDDRQQDNWEILLAIADLVGGKWPEQARAAALALSVNKDAYVCLSTQLLTDIQQVFEDKKASKISTVDLIKALCEDEEAPWATFNGQKNMTPRQLGNQLNRYGIHSKTVRQAKYDTPKGYSIDQFEEAFARYVTQEHPGNLPPRRNVSPQSMPLMDSGVADQTQPPRNVEAAKAPQIRIRHTDATLEPSPALECGVVAEEVDDLDAMGV